MSEWAPRTMIVPVAVASTARQLAADLAGLAGSGMWTTPVGPSPDAEPTHYISAGLIEQPFADLLDSPEALAQATGMPLEQAQALLSACIVSPDEPQIVMAEHGLVLTSPTGDAE